MTAGQLYLDLLDEAAADELLPAADSVWCAQDDQTIEAWAEMGGVPADLSTVECAVRMLFALHRRHIELAAVLDEVLAL